MKGGFRFSKRLASFGFAVRGMAHVLKTQHNAWIHLVASVVAVIAGFVLCLSLAEWCWIVFAIAVVWVTETLNTAIELVCDAVTTGVHPLIGKAKDVAAGAVLIASTGALVIGLMIFLPRVIALSAGG